MEVTIIYSGILAEKAGKTKESFSGVKSLSEIRKMLAVRYNGFNKLHYVIALNGVIIHEDAGNRTRGPGCPYPPYSWWLSIHCA